MANEKIQRPVPVFVNGVRCLELLNCEYATENNSTLSFTSGGAIVQKGQRGFSLTFSQVEVVRGQSVDIEALVDSSEVVTVQIPRGSSTREAKGIFTRASASSDNQSGQHHGTYNFVGYDPKTLK